VTDEDEAPAAADDPRNYDYEEEDMRMSSPEPPIAADPRNYDPELEPAPDAVPVEQQASTSRMTLDDPTPRDARFLRFRPRPAAEIASASCASLVEEILQQSAEDVEGEEQLENVLLMMSEVFGQAGRLLGKRHRGGKGKGRAA
jgi:FtsZ-interacting cell division protein ZipA